MDIAVTSPFPFAALPRVWRWIEGFRHKVADDFSPTTLPEFLTAMAAKWELQHTWAILADGELGGLVTFEQFNAWRGTAHVLLKPEFQGKGVAMRACRQAVGEMFARFLIGKLEFSVIAKNLAIGSLLTNLGATREGTLKAQTLVKGEPTDVWVYGLTKKVFEEKHVVPIRVELRDQNHADADGTGAGAVRPAPLIRDQPADRSLVGAAAD